MKGFFIPQSILLEREFQVNPKAKTANLRCRTIYSLSLQH
mgnify:CR=1 FL=1